MTVAGANALHTYSSLQLPSQAFDGLTAKQKRLMGWSSTQIGAEESEFTTRGVANDASASLTRRRREQQTSTSQSQSNPMISSQPSSMASGLTIRSGPAPIPTASLRFLDPTANTTRSSLGLGTSFPNSSFGSPFRTRGLDSHHVQDEADLQELVASRQFGIGAGSGVGGGIGSSESFGKLDAGMLTPPSTRYGGVDRFSPRAMGGFNSPTSATPFGQPTPYTPPYATSMRETLAQPVVAATHNANGGSQPFIYPGMRHTLDDPRADAELHDLFPTTLATIKKTTTDFDQAVRRIRAWLVATILRPFLRSFEQSTLNMSLLAKAILSEPGVGNHFTRDEMLLLQELSRLASETRGGPIQTSTRVEEAITILRQRFPKRPECMSRDGVELILSVPTSNAQTKVLPQTKEYVARRLATLCAPGDDSLSKYSVAASGVGSTFGTNSFGGFGLGVSGGGLFGARSQQPTNTSSPTPSTYPTDAQILMHAFCCHMESMLPGFTSQHIRDAADGTPIGVNHLPRPTDGAACIVQLRSPPLAPYYIVARAPPTSSSSNRSTSSAVKFLTEPGRPSLFQALVLWIIELPVGSRIGREFTGIITDA